VATTTSSRKPCGAERPIFVVGSQRSGTTLLRYILCSHPRIYVPPESNFLPRFFRGRAGAVLSRREAIRIAGAMLDYRMFMRDWRDDVPDPDSFVDGLPSLTPRCLVDAIYSRYAQRFGADRWGDKSPLYADHVDLLAELFPAAQVVHVIRDGRDVSVSMAAAYRGRRFFYMDRYFAARTWRRRVRAARRSGARLGPDGYHEVRYEQLVAQPEKVLRELCRFLGEDFAPSMMQPHLEATGHHHSRGIHASVREPLTTRSVGRWRTAMSLRDQRVFSTGSGSLLAELGYETPELGAMPLRERGRLAFFVMKYAVLDVGRRLVERTRLFHPTALIARPGRGSKAQGGQGPQ
jgi:hypothetical protein